TPVPVPTRAVPEALPAAPTVVTQSFNTAAVLPADVPAATAKPCLERRPAFLMDPTQNPARSLSTLGHSGSFRQDNKLFDDLSPPGATAAKEAKDNPETTPESRPASKSKTTKQDPDADALPVLTPEAKAKYANYWTGYFKRSKSSQSESELSVPPTPTSVAPGTPVGIVRQDSQEMLEGLLQKARADPAVRALLLSTLQGMDSSAPAEAASPKPASLISTAPELPSKAATPSPSGAAPELAGPAGSGGMPQAPQAVPSPATAVLPPMPGSTPTVPAANAQNFAVAVPDDFKCSSKTHPNAWAKYSRFVLRNENCKELAKAWQSLGMNQPAGGDQRLAMFQKWVASGGRGLELEAAVQMKVIRETEEVDTGDYVTWDAILSHFGGDINKSIAFAERRRGEHKGTKRDRNDPSVEKFLLWKDATVTERRKTIDEVCIDVGCNAADVEQLLSAMDNDPMFYKRHALPERSAGPGSLNVKEEQMNADDGKTSGKTHKINPKEIYTEMPDNCSSEHIKDFVSQWMAAVSDSQGQAALQDLESQGQLIGLIEAAKLGLAECRKEMGAINLDDVDAWTRVSHMCEKTKPFVVSYKKHTRTAQSLISSAKREAAGPAKKKAKTEKTEDET
ncbi:unnamed protein product, partial [Symbiodinium sp. CCMP2456]